MKKLYLVFVCLFVNGFVHGQSLGLVTLEGKQFKLNGSNFYPRVINYEVEISSPDPATTTWQSDGYITPLLLMVIMVELHRNFTNALIKQLATINYKMILIILQVWDLIQ